MKLGLTLIALVFGVILLAFGNEYGVIGIVPAILFYL